MLFIRSLVKVTFLQKDNQITLRGVSGWGWLRHAKKEKLIEFDAVTLYFIRLN